MYHTKKYDLLCENGLLSFQPYLERNNSTYRELFPNTAALAGIISEVYEVDDFDDRKNIALPDICADIMTFYTDNECYNYFMGGAATIQKMNELSFMPMVKTIFGVRLRTGALGNLFRFGLKDIGNCQIPMRDTFYDGRVLEEKMAEASTFEERWDTIAQYFIDQMRKNIYDKNILINYVVKRIKESNGNIKIQDLAADTGYSDRYLRRVVKTSLGVSMKQFEEVTKFQWMCNYHQNKHGQVELSDLAIQAGYYDQSHMNLCCKRLTGELPTEIFGLYSA
jgi:AraC-like DNA-binding protein